MENKFYKAWDAVAAAVEELSPLEVGAITCMMIDYAAYKAGMTSMEFIEEVTPMIRDVNEKFGEIKIDS